MMFILFFTCSDLPVPNTFKFFNKNLNEKKIMVSNLKEFYKSIKILFIYKREKDSLL